MSQSKKYKIQSVLLWLAASRPLRTPAHRQKLAVTQATGIWEVRQSWGYHCREQLSQLKIYGTMLSLSSRLRTHAAPRKGSLRKKNKKTKLKHLSNLAIRCQEACSLQPRIHFCITPSLFRWNMQYWVFSSRLPSSKARGRLQSSEIKACTEVRRRRRWSRLHLHNFFSG